jgi:hypothetical protein
MAIAILDDPTMDGHIWTTGSVYYRVDGITTMDMGRFLQPPSIMRTHRGYVEWDISGIPDGATITKTVFKYAGYQHAIDCHINEMMAVQPSITPDEDGDGEGNNIIFNEAGEGTVYADPPGFPVAAANQSVDLGASANSDLQSQLLDDWFAIGFQSDDEETDAGSVILTEEEGEPIATPKPTLYVEYTLPPPELGYKSGNIAAKMAAAGLI